jgi:hypothetical protein
VKGEKLQDICSGIGSARQLGGAIAGLQLAMGAEIQHIQGLARIQARLVGRLAVACGSVHCFCPFLEPLSHCGAARFNSN